MKAWMLFLLLATLGTVAYHIGQKALPASANPMVLLIPVWAIALLLAVASAPFFGRVEAIELARASLSWPVLVLGAGVFLIEIGFLLAYRGAPLNWSGAAVNGLAAVLLVPVALMLFAESFSLQRAGGILLIVAGLLVVAWD
jgi:multidrug transporter EmrE-like cation transporter